MTIATGLFKVVSWKKETTWGSIAAATGPNGTSLPRTQSTLSLNKATYESQSIRPDAQVQDFRHGVRTVGGNINGEVQPKTFSSFLGSLLRGSWAAGVSKTNTEFGTLAAVASTAKLVVTTSDWVSQGFKVGDVIRLSGTTGNAATNFRILSFATSNTEAVVDPAPADMAADASFTVAVVGKKVFTPQSGLVDESYTFEHWFEDIAQSERFVGCKIASASINLPATGLGTIQVGILGKNMQSGTAQYFTSPTANGDYGITAAVNGAISVSGVNVANVTGISINIQGGLTSGAAVGSNVTPGIFPGIIRVNGQVSAYFQDATLRDIFVNETIAQLDVMLTSNGDANADFIKFFMPRVKLGGDNKDDGVAGLIETIPYTALIDTTGGTGTDTDKTTLVIQDTQM